MTFSNKFIYKQLWFYSEGDWVHGSKDGIKFQIHFVIISILNRCVGDLKAEISNVGLHRQTMYSIVILSSFIISHEEHYELIFCRFYIKEVFILLVHIFLL